LQVFVRFQHEEVAGDLSAQLMKVSEEWGADI